MSLPLPTPRSFRWRKRVYFAVAAAAVALGFAGVVGWHAGQSWLIEAGPYHLLFHRVAALCLSLFGIAALGRLAQRGTRVPALSWSLVVLAAMSLRTSFSSPMSPSLVLLFGVSGALLALEPHLERALFARLAGLSGAAWCAAGLALGAAHAGGMTELLAWRWTAVAVPEALGMALVGICLGLLASGIPQPVPDRTWWRKPAQAAVGILVVTALLFAQVRAREKGRLESYFQIQASEALRNVRAPEAWRAAVMKGFAVRGVRRGRTFLESGVPVGQLVAREVRGDSTFELRPTKSWLRENRSYTSELLLGLGLALSTLLAVLVTLLESARSGAFEARLAGQQWKQMMKARAKAESALRAKTLALEESDRLLRIQAEELKKANEIAVQAARQKADFLANMSHEIRTPLNAVIGMSGLLLESPLSSEQREYASIVSQSANGLLSLVNDILDFSKIEAGHLRLEEIDFELSDVVHGVELLFGLGARQKNLALITEVAPEAPPFLRGDPIRLRQVLTNIVGNALKFTAQGAVRLSVRSAARDGEGVEVTFEVTDTGVGIPREAHDRIFRDFSQVDTSTARKFGGTGLGLAISKRLVEMMGGTIGFESEVGKGTCFHFSVPMKVGQAEGLVIQAPLRAVGGLAGKRILVVEDNAINQKVTAALLQTLGVRVEIAASGEAALVTMSRARPDLVLMDCQMPGVDGYETTRRLRAHEKEHSRTRLPVLALTAHALEGDRERCLQAGMDDYLSKPIEREKLVRALERWLGPSVAPEEPGELVRVGGLRELSALKPGPAGLVFVDELVALFRKEIPENLAVLASAVERNDEGQVAELAHKMKSGCANLGASAMVERCQSIEALARAGQLGQVRREVENLHSLFLPTLERFERWRKEQSGVKAA